MMNIKIGLYSFVSANPADLRDLKIVSEKIRIVTRIVESKFLCFNHLRQINQCGIL